MAEDDDYDREVLVKKAQKVGAETSPKCRTES